MAEIFEFKDFFKKRNDLNKEFPATIIGDVESVDELKRARKEFHEKGGFDKINKIMTGIKLGDLSSLNLNEKKEIVRNYAIGELLGWITDHEEVEWGGKEAFFKAVADEILDRFSRIK